MNLNVPVSASRKSREFLSLLQQQAHDHGFDRYEQIVVLDWEAFETLLRRGLGPLAARVTLMKIRYVDF